MPHPETSGGPKVILLGRVDRFDDPKVLEGLPPGAEVIKSMDDAKKALAEWRDDKTGEVPQPILKVVGYK